MDKEKILQQEEANDGQTVFLFYDEMIGLFVAYGMSAYYTTLVTDPYLSFSDVLQLPVALLSRNHILYLRQSLVKLEHTPHVFYKFRTRMPIGDAGYKKWAPKIKAKHEGK